MPSDGHGPFKKGARHDGLLKFAGRNRRTLAHYEDFKAALVGFGLERCDPPLDRAECERQARDLFERFAPEKAPQTGSLVVRRAADIEPEAIRWLWPGRVARGKMTLVVGHPGLGKSQLSLAMAATVSTGRRWPDGSECEPGSVIVLSAEDGDADTIVPRLIANGADLSRVHLTDGTVKGFTRDGREVSRGLCLAQDIERLAERIESTPDVALVVIDPISAYLGPVNSHNNAETRSALAPLAALAAEHRVAVLAISHLNKSDNVDAITRVTGSMAFVATARAAWLVGKDPEDDNRSLFVPLKNNLGPDRSGLAFRITPTSVETRQGDEVRTSAVAWLTGGVSTTAAQILAAARSGGDAESGARSEAAAFLKDLLADGPVDAGKSNDKRRPPGSTGQPSSAPSQHSESSR